ncbi:hypothetical protein OOK27_48110 [Streptomyces canus]|uniref:hypothetical protein n=1 Tax=Streptomyces canus TaxID=58343 RepID=UPI00225A7E3C|nr:hypothetical protein [Streptomyces canus]MCX5261807.1 hypothetical protein [Streptomyces canus]
MKHTAARPRHAVLQATTPPHTGTRTASRRPDRGRQGARARVSRAVLRLRTRVQEGLQEAARRPDRGDISTTTVIIWVAAVTGAVLIAGTIAVVIAKYNGQLNGL